MIPPGLAKYLNIVCTYNIHSAQILITDQRRGLARMRAAMMTAASLALTMTVLGNAWSQRQQFYPSVVYITKSNPSMAVIYLQVDLFTNGVLKIILYRFQSLVLVILMGKLMRKVFFGQLRAAEFEHLMERSWYAVTETCLAFTVFK